MILPSIQKTTPFLLHCSGFLLLGCLAFQHAHAQRDFLVKKEVFDQTSDSSTVVLEYIVAPNSRSLASLAEELEPDNYPLVIVQEQVFTPGIRLVKGLELQILNYQLKDKEWAVLDSINIMKIERLNEIAGLERARVDVQKRANQDLNEQIDNLSRQLTLTTDLAEQSIKGRNRKNLTIGILGGAVGFTIGAMMAVIAGL